MSETNAEVAGASRETNAKAALREVKPEDITLTVRQLCMDANCVLPGGVRRRIEEARAAEDWQPAVQILDRIRENYEIAEREYMPICQDTGVACVFVEIGQDIHVCGDINEAINEGVRQGYADGYLRKSVVRDPLRRENTNDNTPAMTYFDIVPGDKLRITVAPKGFGSENMSGVMMLSPSAGVDGVKDFVVSMVEKAGPNACPPLFVGVGLGGTFDKAALLAKKALLRPADDANEDPFYAALEDELLSLVNATGIGPQGFGGKTTALCVKVNAMPTHIAGLPVAVNINCHVARHKSAEV